MFMLLGSRFLPFFPQLFLDCMPGGKNERGDLERIGPQGKVYLTEFLRHADRFRARRALNGQLFTAIVFQGAATIGTIKGF
ncbi:MAG TPA: hypothetical protein VMC09_18185 [Anaerolineales bacterium]|nr:hypothetical protein [Anaerolineales bacterium]